MRENVFCIPEECDEIRSVPAALVHSRRQANDESQISHRPWRAEENRRHQTVVAIDDGERPCLIDTDQNDSAKFRISRLKPATDRVDLGDKRAVELILSFAHTISDFEG